MVLRENERKERCVAQAISPSTDPKVECFLANHQINRSYDEIIGLKLLFIGPATKPPESDVEIISEGLDSKIRSSISGALIRVKFTTISHKYTTRVPA